MDEASAENVVRTSIRVMALLNQLAADLRKALSGPAFDAERLRIGGVMGDVVSLINAAVALHPSLDVEGDGAWQRVGRLDEPHWLRMPRHS